MKQFTKYFTKLFGVYIAPFTSEDYPLLPINLGSQRFQNGTLSSSMYLWYLFWKLSTQYDSVLINWSLVFLLFHRLIGQHVPFFGWQVRDTQTYHSLIVMDLYLIFVLPPEFVLASVCCQSYWLRRRCSWDLQCTQDAGRWCGEQCCCCLHSSWCPLGVGILWCGHQILSHLDKGCHTTNKSRCSWPPSWNDWPPAPW